MLTFNVWPSQISDFIKYEISEAINKDILSISHRSKDFTEISRNAISGLRKFYNIPDSYKIFYTGSATDAMMLSLRNLCSKKSFHFTNGNFSELFAKISFSIWNKTQINEAQWWFGNDFKNAKITKDVDFISITHNETSTWVSCTLEDISFIRNTNPWKILTVDITSSAWVYNFDFDKADVWIFSVQKCFWLPAWLWFIIISPEAYEKSIKLSSEWLNTSWIFSFESMNGKMEESFQTLFTPNVLNIYLFSRILDFFNKNWWIENNLKDAIEKYSFFEDYINSRDDIYYFVQEKEVRSLSTVCLKMDKELVKNVKESCKKMDIIVWSWYWKIKENTIRIANFPSLLFQDFKKLVGVLNQVS